MSDLCLLIPTFERYRVVADFTRRQLDAQWPGHPPIFFCGLTGNGPEFLELRDDPTDWMILVRSACGDLLARGFTKIYLILDDHPPLDPCHPGHLNETLPALLDQLKAAFINLHGWGQHKPRQGELLGPQFHHLEKPAHEYLWKFALHPGLWNLRALADLLDLLLADPDPATHTCWKFERRAGDQTFALPPHLQDAAYRVCGAHMTAWPEAWWFARRRQLELFVSDVWRFFIRVIRGQPARDLYDRDHLGCYHFYDGPYPLFWSGLMKKGGINPDLLYFLRRHGRSAFLAEVEQLAASIPARPPSPATSAS